MNPGQELAFCEFNSITENCGRINDSKYIGSARSYWVYSTRQHAESPRVKGW